MILRKWLKNQTQYDARITKNSLVQNTGSQGDENLILGYQSKMIGLF